MSRIKAIALAARIVPEERLITAILRSAVASKLGKEEERPVEAVLLLLVKWLTEGMSVEQVNSFIDELDLDEIEEEETPVQEPEPEVEVKEIGSLEDLFKHFSAIFAERQ